MKCLTCLEPWASAMVAGIKPIENRPWRMRHRGPLAIHAGKSLAWFTAETCAHLNSLWPEFPADRDEAVRLLKGNLGCVVGVVHVRDCLTLEEALAAGFTRERDIARGPYCAILDTTQARRLRVPRAWRGQQGMFEIPDEVIADVVQSRGIELPAR